MSYDSYIVCTSPRSGSTLLCRLLAATGVAGNPESWFHEPSVTKWLVNLELAEDAALSERDNLVRIFDAAIAKGSNNEGVFGLRLQRHSFDFLQQKLSAFNPGCLNDAQRFKTVFGNTLYIHLSREDKIRQAVSYVRAMQSGLWHIAPDGTELERLSAPGKLKYDADEIHKRVEEMTAYDQSWKQWFASQQIKPLQISYESLSGNPIETLGCVLDELGLNPNVAVGVEVSVAKLADRNSDKWVDRFRSRVNS